MNEFTTGYDADKDPDPEEGKEEERIKAWVDDMINGLMG